MKKKDDPTVQMSLVNAGFATILTLVSIKKKQKTIHQDSEKRTELNWLAPTKPLDVSHKIN